MALTASTENLPCIPVPCVHHWIARHNPGHLVYWVRVCQFCQDVDWDDLDQEIHVMLEGRT